MKEKLISEQELLNIGLALTMKWQTSDLQPIQERFSTKFKHLTIEQLNYYIDVCKSTMVDCKNFILEYLQKCTIENKKIKDSVFKKDWLNYAQSKYSWINQENLNQLLNQGFYYAWYEEFTDCIICEKRDK